MTTDQFLMNIKNNLMKFDQFKNLFSNESIDYDSKYPIKTKKDILFFIDGLPSPLKRICLYIHNDSSKIEYYYDKINKILRILRDIKAFNFNCILNVSDDCDLLIELFENYNFKYDNINEKEYLILYNLNFNEKDLNEKFKIKKFYIYNKKIKKNILHFSIYNNNKFINFKIEKLVHSIKFYSLLNFNNLTINLLKNENN